jgi:activating signal cointegrator 1
MPSLYCWGDRLIPYRILSETPESVTVEVDGLPRVLRAERVRGRCEWPYSPGDRVRVLMGYNWHPGTVGEGLRVDLDDGRHCPIWSNNNVRSLYMPPKIDSATLQPALQIETVEGIASNAPNRRTGKGVLLLDKDVIEPKPAAIGAGTAAIKIITLWQPWASLIAYGLKRYETRSWETNYRGRLAIHAAKRKMKPEDLLIWEAAKTFVSEDFPDALALSKVKAEDLPLGAIVAFADLTDCLQMDAALIEDCPLLEDLCGDWKVNRFAWQLNGVCRVGPYPYKGGQGLLTLPPDIEAKCRSTEAESKIL